MSVSTRTSGLIQRVTPFVSSASIEIDGLGTSAVASDQSDALKDPNSPRAIPDVPAGEAPYDGYVAFGIMVVDPSLDGPGETP